MTRIMLAWRQSTRKWQAHPQVATAGATEWIQLRLEWQVRPMQAVTPLSQQQPRQDPLPSTPRTPSLQLILRTDKQ